jgi:hypothetical protein
MLRRLARKWWFWVGASGCLIAALVVGGVYAEWKITRARGEARRDEAVRRLDAEQPGWRATALSAAHNDALPPKDRNAAERALAAARLTPASFEKMTHEERWWTALKPGVLPHPEDLCESAPLYRECGEAIAVARTIRHLPRGGFQFRFAEPDPLQTLLADTQKVRGAGALLEYDAATLAAAGRADEAVESCHAILNCGRGIGDEPTLISQLVRMAQVMLAKSATERTLGLGEPAAGLAELQAAFAEELPVPRLTYGLRGERAMMFLLTQSVDDGLIPPEDAADALSGQPGGSNGGALLPRIGLTVYRKHLPGQQAAMLDLYDRMLEADKLSGPERAAALDRITLPPRNFENMLVYLLMPAVQKVGEADTRTRAHCATAVAALACERYRRQIGRWPESLAAIPRDILPAVPEDPYTGRPLSYRLTDDGAVAYAAGPNGVDDGGVTLDSTGKPGTDVGFRLLDPPHRRQLPPPRESGQVEFDPELVPDEPSPENEP